MTAVWVVVLLAVVALAYYGMWLGWRNRAKRQADIPEPDWLEPDAYFPEAARNGAAFYAALTLVLDAMQGMASTRTVHAHGPSEASRLDTLHDIAARALAPERGGRIA